MDDTNRRALLREVQKSQTTCGILRAGIMVAMRYCKYPRWVPYPRSDESMTWHHERLKLGDSLRTPFAREFGLDVDRSTFWRRFHATYEVRAVDEVEKTTYDDTCSPEALQQASLRLASLLPALQIVFMHAQEYGVCWAWLKTVEGPAGTQTLTGVSLAQALVERSVGRTSDAQFALRKAAADWLTKANVLYVGDERQPADFPPPKK